MIRIIISLTIAMMIGLYPVASMAQDTSGPTISKIIATHEDAVEVLYEKMRGKSREGRKATRKSREIRKTIFLHFPPLVSSLPGRPGCRGSAMLAQAMQTKVKESGEK